MGPQTKSLGRGEWDEKTTSVRGSLGNTERHGLNTSFDNITRNTGRECREHIRRPKQSPCLDSVPAA